MKKRTAAGIAVILVLAMALGGCGTAEVTETAQEESAVTVSMKQVENGTITLTNSFVGTISPQETVMIIPLTAGTVTETFFEVGDTVAAGDVLFKIDDEAAKLQYETAQLNVENARQTADSTMENLESQRDTTMENLESQRDTTMENLLNQQDSTELQLESSRMSAQSTFESAQIGYVTAKEAYEKYDKQYKEAKKMYDSAQSAAASRQREDEEIKARIAEKEDEKAAAEEEVSELREKASRQKLETKQSETDLGEDGIEAQADEDNAIEKLEQKIEELGKSIEGLTAQLGGSTNNSSTLANTLSTLETARDQAYQAYLSARSGYHTAQKALELADESEAMTREQLEETMQTTEDELDRTMRTTKDELDRTMRTTKDQLSLSLDMAQLSAAQAELALDYYTVTTPVSGIVESKGVEVNGIASQSSPAYTIVNNNTMTVTFQVSENVKNTLSVGQKVTLERNNNTYTATITEIGASVNPQSGLFQIKACAEVSSAELPSGVSVKVSADTYRAENTMIIPYDAVYYENEGAYVYTSVNGRAVKTPITTGIFDDDNIVVTGGLNLGDTVVTSWSPQLTDGVLLRAAAADTPSDADGSKAE